MNDKKEKLKELFYSSMTEIELKHELGLSHKEYRELLNSVKEELGLPLSYRRKPHRNGLYVQDSYYLLQVYEGDFEIIKYYPTLKSAQKALENCRENGDGIFLVGRATDDVMKELIKEQYFNNKNNWETIMRKLLLPYHKFYQLLNEIKDELNKKNYKSFKPTRFIYKYVPNGKYMIRRFIDGKYHSFGYYSTFEEAKFMRDYLEEINWDVELFKQKRNEVNS